MSNLENLLATFQTQFSDVMETVLKTAMYEVTRLVEEGILEEVKRKAQEVQSLKKMLQWTEKKLNVDDDTRGGKMTGRCVDCAKNLELSTDTEEEKSDKQQDDVCSGPCVKKEKSVDRWTKGQTQKLSDPQSLEEDPSVRAIPDQQIQSQRMDGKEDKRLEQRCVDCGRLGISDEEKSRAEDKCLKLESALQERVRSSQDTDIETDNRDVDQTKLEAENTTGTTDPGLQGEKLDRLLKEESLHLPSDTNGTQEKWVVNVDETDTSGLPGPSKFYIDQKIPKCHENWEDTFEQKTQSEPNGNSGDPSETLFQSRYGMEDLGSFDKTAGYVNASMMEMSHLDGFQESPTNLGKELNYMEHFEEGVEGLGGTGHQAYQIGTPRSRRHTVSLQPGSPSKANIDVDGELSCLLINEEGYLQDPGLLYSDHVSGDSEGRFQGQGHRTQSSLHSAEDICNVPHDFNDTSDLVERNKSRAGGKSGRKHICQQCSMLFPDSASLKAHKQTHRGNAQGSSYSCGQCGKTFTQASHLKVHQRIHAGDGHLCTQCGKSFPYYSDLKRHNCVQSGYKPYCCSVCGKKFSRFWNLKLHRRIHTQEKPHCCSLCEKSFTRADILKNHQRTHTGERPYCCSICGLSFKRLDHLKSHQRKHS